MTTSHFGLWLTMVLMSVIFFFLGEGGLFHICLYICLCLCLCLFNFVFYGGPLQCVWSGYSEAAATSNLARFV